jgi:hypothetical protein
MTQKTSAAGELGVNFHAGFEFNPATACAEFNNFKRFAVLSNAGMSHEHLAATVELYPQSDEE